MDSPTETLPASEARHHVSALYQAHAVALVRLAVLMTGDQPTAEDVVQDAFLGLYRRWQALDDAGKALGYLRSSVLNGCRSVHRVRHRRQGRVLAAGACLLALGAGFAMIPAAAPGAGSAILRVLAAAAVIAAVVLVMPGGDRPA